MHYDLIFKISLEELKNYLRISGLKLNGRKKVLVARVFAANENCDKVIKIAVEIEDDLKTEYLAKLKIDIGIYQILSKFLMDGWTKTRAWSFGPCFYTKTFELFNILFSSELGWNDLNDYKSFKTY